MKIAFIGHRNIDISTTLYENLKSLILTYINQDAVTFLFGSRSKFDSLCWKVVKELKDAYPHIMMIYVRAEYEYIDKSYNDYLLEFYDDTIYPEGLQNAGKSIYIKRNKYMIDNADICVFYYDDKYKIEGGKSQKSGTKIAFDYAIRKNKPIVNIFNMVNDHN